MQGCTPLPSWIKNALPPHCWLHVPARELGLWGPGHPAYVTWQYTLQTPTTNF